MSATPSISSQPYAPAEALQPYVTAFLYNEVSISEPGQTIDLFPVGHSVLSFSMDDLPLFFRGRQVISNYNITGQLTESYKMRTSSGVYRTVMVLLKPYGAYRFFGGDQQLFVNSFEDLNKVDASFAAMDAVLQRINKPEEIIRVLESWLVNLLEKRPPSTKALVVEAICNRILSENGNITISALQLDHGISRSSLERYFKEVVGISTKLFSRIVRFNHVYHTICSGRYSTWMDVVNDYSYFDQAHFIKEFKAFYGYTPSQLHQSTLSIAGHVKNMELGEQS